MKKLAFLLGISIFTALLFPSSIYAQRPAIPHDEAIEQQIAERMSKMTLDEKIGQMLQFSVDQVTLEYPQGQSGPFRLDEEKLNRLLGKYHIGSILNMLGGEASTPEVWRKTIAQIQKANKKYTDIPVLYGLDQVHGTTYTAGGTLFPQHIGMTATFNPALAKQMGQITAYETRACDVNWIFCPDLDLGRKPSWPRCYEGMGEDPLLAAVMGEAYLEGLQGQDPNHIGKYNVGTTLKHYMAYGTPDNGIDRTPANVSLQDLREKYFEPFRRVIKHGALGVMTNSSILNGMNGCANKELLTNWLKRDLNWDGMIITDWADAENLRLRDHIAVDKKEAIELTVNAGADMLMVTSDTAYFSLLKQLVLERKISMERIDDAVSRVLRLKYRLGLFSQKAARAKDYPEFASEEHQAVARRTAVESIVLLKNDNDLLPLKKGQKILVCGPNANTMRGLNGGWTYTWQGSNNEKFTTAYKTIFQALAEKLGQENVRLAEGVSYNNKGNWQDEFAEGIDSTVEAARNCDVIVACIGENSYSETTGNILDDNISDNQRRLVEALAKTGKPIVLILNEGRPRIIHSLVPKAGAIVDVMLPGNYGGEALALLLSGEENFSGKLPFTYPSFVNAFTTYDFKVCERRDVMPGVYDYWADTNVEWWFGDGMSYTTFAYSNLRANRTTFGHDDTLTFSVDVTNTGRRDGKEVVMLFSSDLAARDVIPGNRRLRAFEKVNLKPGEKKTITFKLHARDLAYVNRSGQWVMEKGEYKMTIGDQSIMINAMQDHQFAK